jgi:hypothetical protein
MTPLRWRWDARTTTYIVACDQLAHLGKGVGPVTDNDRTRELDISAWLPTPRTSVEGGTEAATEPAASPAPVTPPMTTRPADPAPVTSTPATATPSAAPSSGTASAAAVQAPKSPPRPATSTATPGLPAVAPIKVGEKTAPTELLWRDHDETMLLPVFVTGGAAEATPDVPATPVEAVVVAPPTVVKRSHDDRLPSDERNMLIFVTALLALGTLAIVAMASIGR